MVSFQHFKGGGEKQFPPPFEKGGLRGILCSKKGDRSIIH